MEARPQPVNQASPAVRRSRPRPDASTVVLVVMGATLAGIVFFLLTSAAAP
jgi:hypothetical protein